MIRDYWVYQNREVSEPAHPWALYIVKQWSNTEDETLSVTIYSEDIENEEHALSFLDWHYDNGAYGYAQRIVSELSKFTNVWGEDETQLYLEMLDILYSLKR